MEPFLLPFSTMSYGLVAILLLMYILYLFYRYGYAPYTVFSSQGIPGPKPKPFIGSLDLFGKFDGDTLKMTSFLVKKYGPISGVYFGTKPFLYITDLNMIREITIKNFDKFTDRVEHSAGFQVDVEGQKYFGISSISGDEWRKRRHFISPAFSTHKMKLMEPLMKASTTRLVKNISEHAKKGDAVDLHSLIGKMTMEVILSTAFGRSIDIQGGQGEELVREIGNRGKWAVPMQMLRFMLFSMPVTAPLVVPLIRNSDASSTIHRYAEAALAIVELRKKERNADPKKDLLQLMLEAKDEKGKPGLSAGEILVDGVGVLFAAHKTTGSAIAFAMYLLAAHPEAQEKLADEILDYFEENPDKSIYDATHDLSYLDSVISESLRLYPSVPGTARLCNEDCVINGISIKAGMQVFIPIYDVHRDPEVWPEPEKFIPERFSPGEKAKRHPCAYLPFGLGPRACVGTRFALMEAKMALIEVVRDFRIELSPETKASGPMELVVEVNTKLKNRVFVTFHARD